jgi:hypothetical protein
VDFDQILYTLQSLPRSELQPFIAGAAAVAVAMLLALFLESRLFKRSGRVGSWLGVRIVSAFAAPLTFALVVLPARAVSGMEALAVFYLLLFTVAPLAWFGSHWLAGRWIRPPLAPGESMLLAVSGLAILAIPAFALGMAQLPLREAAREVDRRNLPSPGAVPMVHAAQPLQRFTMPGAGVVFTQTLKAPPGVQLELVERRVAGLWPTDHSTAHPMWCVQGADVHLMWSASEPAPYLRLHWTRDERRSRSEFFPNLAAAQEPREFTIAFRPDGFDPVAPIPRSRVHFEMRRADGSTWTHTNIQQPGETLAEDCLMPGYTRARWKEEGAVQAVRIMFQPQQGAPLRALLQRPSP